MSFDQYGREPILVTVSHDNMANQIKQYLYSLGYASGRGEHIASISFGALHEEHIPIQIWIENENNNEEVTVIEYNGKSSKKL